MTTVLMILFLLAAAYSSWKLTVGVTRRFLQAIADYRCGRSVRKVYEVARRNHEVDIYVDPETYLGTRIRDLRDNARNN